MIVDAFLCGLTFILELAGVIVVAMLIQLTVYQLTGVSLYNKLFKGLNRLDKYLTNLVEGR